MSSASADTSHGPLRTALRLTFSHTAATVELLSVHRAEMTLPPGEAEPIVGARAGSWIEVRDAAGGVLYQRVLGDPIRFDRESPASPESGRMEWHFIAEPREQYAEAFEVLVPEFPQAASIILYASPPDAITEPAIEVVRLEAAALQPEQDERI